MWDELLKGLLIAAGAAAAAEVGSKLLTGKWAHEHLFEWWCAIRDKITAWVHANQNLGIARVVGWVAQKLDNAICAAKQLVKVWFVGVDSKGQNHTITEEELSADEVAQQFPELMNSQEVLVQTCSYGAGDESDTAECLAAFSRTASATHVFVNGVCVQCALSVEYVNAYRTDQRCEGARQTRPATPAVSAGQLLDSAWAIIFSDSPNRDFERANQLIHQAESISADRDILARCALLYGAIHMPIVYLPERKTASNPNGDWNLAAQFCERARGLASSKEVSAYTAMCHAFCLLGAGQQSAVPLIKERLAEAAHIYREIGDADSAAEAEAFLRQVGSPSFPVGELPDGSASKSIADHKQTQSGGKWMHKDSLEWWDQLRERIDAWIKEHQDSRIERVVVLLDQKLDSIAIGANRLVKVRFRGVSADPNVQPSIIHEVNISEEEVVTQFPELRHQDHVVAATYEPMAEDVGCGEQPAPKQLTGHLVTPPVDSTPLDGWYVLLQGQQRQGPIGLQDVRALAAARRIDAGTYVWRKGFKDWIPAGSVAGLLLPSEDEPPPPPPQAFSPSTLTAPSQPCAPSLQPAMVGWQVRVIALKSSAMDLEVRWGNETHVLQYVNETTGTWEYVLLDGRRVAERQGIFDQAESLAFPIPRGAGTSHAVLHKRLSIGFFTVDLVMVRLTIDGQVVYAYGT